MQRIKSIRKEACDIARKGTPINVIVYHPKTEAGKRELAQRAAGVHADFVNQYIKQLTCPSEQKTQLLDAVMKDASAIG